MGIDFSGLKKKIVSMDVPSIAEQFPSLIGMHQYRIPYRKLSQEVARGSKVLDWGCGSGHTSFFLNSMGIRSVGYSFEINPPYRNELFEHVRGEKNDPVTIPFPSDHFDFVISMGVLEHVHESGGSESASLEEIRRVLRPGGTFLCFHLPNSTQWLEPCMRIIDKDICVHDRRYRSGRIRHLIREADLELVEMERYNFLPRNRMRVLPFHLGDSRWFVGSYNGLDRLMAVFFRPLCTNWYFKARKPLAD